jgi:methionyl-tRNA formyltransferase
MRIAVLTQEDPLYILPFFASFLPEASKEIEIAAVYACRSMGKRRRTRLLAELFRLYRPAGFLKLAALQVLARIQSASGLGQLSSIRQLSEKHGIIYRRIDDPNQPEVVSALSALNIDVLVSVACPYILKQHVLAAPARASINVHHAPLPRYKGMMPTFWQMYHGESSVGITVHEIASRIDEGPILHQESIPIIAGESMHQLIRRSKRAGAAAVLRVLRQIAGGTAVPVSSGEEKGSYFTFPDRSEMAEFHRRKLRAI